MPTLRGTGPWPFLVAAILLEVAATLSLKGALERPALLVVVVLGYLGAFGALTFVLRAGMGLGVAYGIWGASGVGLTAVASAAVFDETITPVMAAGLVLVVAGVLCIELGAQAARRARPGPGTPTGGGT